MYIRTYIHYIHILNIHYIYYTYITYVLHTQTHTYIYNKEVARQWRTKIKFYSYNFNKMCNKCPIC